MRRKRLLSLLLSGMVFALSACGLMQESDETMMTKQKNEISEDQIVGKISNGLGRYVEEDYLLPEEMENMVCTARLEDGRFRIVNTEGIEYESKDEGKTWKKIKGRMEKVIGEAVYINAMAISPNGDYFVTFDYMNRKTVSGNRNRYQPVNMIIKADGSTKSFDYSDQQGDFIVGYEITPKGRVLCHDLSGAVIELNSKTAKWKILFHVPGYIDGVTATDRYYIALVEGIVRIFDLNINREIFEDVVLNDELNANGKLRNANFSRQTLALFMEAESEDVIYAATKDGLYRHVIEGTAMEKLIDGSLSSFGIPNSQLVSMYTVEQNDFLIFFQDRRLVRFTYDKTIKSVPDKELNVYGLRDNKTVRQAIVQFQKDNPDTCVRYEVGIPRDSEITIDGAIHNLNDKMLSDAGPDVILMDELSLDSFCEDGMLTDLTPYLTQINWQVKLFPDVAAAYWKDNAIYAIPAKFSLPMIAGKKRYLNSITDMPSLIREMEKIREENPQGPILGFEKEEQVLMLAWNLYGASLFQQNGKVDQAELLHMLQDAKTIYHLEKEEKPKGIGYSTSFLMVETAVGDYEDEATPISEGVMRLLENESSLSFGYSRGFDFDYTLLGSLENKIQNIAIALAALMSAIHFIRVPLPQSVPIPRGKKSQESLCRHYYPNPYRR